jgi:hypothetical protein
LPDDGTCLLAAAFRAGLPAAPREAARAAFTGVALSVSVRGGLPVRFGFAAPALRATTLRWRDALAFPADTGPERVDDDGTPADDPAGEEAAGDEAAGDEAAGDEAAGDEAAEDSPAEDGSADDGAGALLPGAGLVDGDDGGGASAGQGDAGWGSWPSTASTRARTASIASSVRKTTSSRRWTIMSGRSHDEGRRTRPALLHG